MRYGQGPAHLRTLLDFPSCDKEIWAKWPKLKEKVEAMRIKLQS